MPLITVPHLRIHRRMAKPLLADQCTYRFEMRSWRLQDVSLAC